MAKKVDSRETGIKDLKIEELLDSFNDPKKIEAKIAKEQEEYDALKEKVEKLRKENKEAVEGELGEEL